LYFGKLLPFIGRRYTLTNQRVMVRTVFKGKVRREIALAEIEDVRVNADSYQGFYVAGDVEVISKGQVALRLPGVPEPESFCHAIRNACRAWTPSKDGSVRLKDETTGAPLKGLLKKGP
jgi:hypothetical protein